MTPLLTINTVEERVEADSFVKKFTLREKFGKWEEEKKVPTIIKMKWFIIAFP